MKTKKTELSIANDAMRDANYDLAIRYYLTALNIESPLKKHILYNLDFLNKKISTSRKNFATHENYRGWLDGCQYDHIGGWVVNENNTDESVEIEIYANGFLVKNKIIANCARSDLSNFGNGNYGFHIETPVELLDGKEYFIEVRVANSNYVLPSSNKINYIKYIFPENTNALINSIINIKNENNTNSKNSEQEEVIQEIINNTQSSGLGSFTHVLSIISIDDDIKSIFLIAELMDCIIKFKKQHFTYLTKFNCIPMLFEVKPLTENKVDNNIHRKKIYSGVDSLGYLDLVYDRRKDFSHIRIYKGNSFLQNDFFWAFNFNEKITFLSKNIDCLPPTNIIEHDCHYNLDKTIKYKISIIIPLYKRYDLLSILLKSIFSDIDFNKDLSQIIIADDSCDFDCSVVEELLDSYEYNYTYIKNVSNLGFLENCNNAIKFAVGDIVVLMNSDIELPQKWYSRIQAPFSDTSIALATPLATNGENLSIEMPEGFTWREMDNFLLHNRKKGIYPDACTAIGYCLAIRKKCILGDLFSREFKHGYGEDSDLHYRILKLGFRSVVIDNLLVAHDHGASYCLSNIDRNQLRSENYKIFINKWGDTYRSDIKVFEKEKSNWFPNIKASSRCIDVLFVLPSQNTDSGGIKVVYNLVDYLSRNNINTAIVLDGDGERHKDLKYQKINVYKSYKSVIKFISKSSIVFSTCFDTIPISENLAEKLDATHISLIQGPESLFSGGVYFDLYQKLISIPKYFICVSPFLVDYLWNFFGKKSFSINYGPNDLLFFNSNKKERTNTVVISLNSTIEKGSGFSLTAARKFFNAGYKVISFGNFCGEIPNWIDHRGWQSDGELASIFNLAKFYIEGSYYEGLGLIALEAAKCGTIPIIRKNGSSQHIFDQCCDKLSWSSIDDLTDTINFALSLLDNLFIVKQQDFINAAASFNQKSSLDSFLCYIKDITE
jgi:GT2 family glycosyltransferase